MSNTEEKYKKIGLAIKEIKRHSHNLTPQQISTLCGQAKAGNPEAALRGLRKLLQQSADAVKK